MFRGKTLDSKSSYMGARLIKVYQFRVIRQNSVGLGMATNVAYIEFDSCLLEMGSFNLVPLLSLQSLWSLGKLAKIVL